MEVLQVKNISKQYGTKENAVQALRNISFSVVQGEFVSIVGTSGSGKSTLLNLIGGLDVPSQGEIIIRNHNIARLERKELTIFRRRNIGFVFQNYSLMPVLNVYDNVVLPVTFDRGKHVDHQFIQELLKDLGLWEKRKRFPNELSGGQQQRVALARALANKPAIILADEPTGNLDSRTTLEVMGVLKNSCRKYHQTILMVTHNEGLAQNCDRILHIEDGMLLKKDGESL
ncbi:ABC transporter ATP-binding protein [Bariatricus sp. SGI.154]|uniref:ABC transporter ATP-binding protein n=1 Tax=Bariatricus sp. SGI.154 TaxID=3420549 RepID=UPI003D064705